MVHTSGKENWLFSEEMKWKTMGDPRVPWLRQKFENILSE